MLRSMTPCTLAWPAMLEVGAFRSGELDSSTIMACIQRCMDTKVRALSVRFDTQGHLFDETHYAWQLQYACDFEFQVERVRP